MLESSLMQQQERITELLFYSPSNYIYMYYNNLCFEWQKRIFYDIVYKAKNKNK